jgi:hypothetical protein
MSEWKIDPEDAYLLEGRNWRPSNVGGAWYVVSRRYDRVTHRCQTTLLHRHLMGAKMGEFVDHANGDTLDNRRSNLRICTKRQNQQNSRKRQTWGGKPTKSNLKGAYRGKTGRWFSHIRTPVGKVYLGAFDTDTEAHAAYVEAAKKYHGEFARID